MSSCKAFLAPLTRNRAGLTNVLGRKGCLLLLTRSFLTKEDRLRLLQTKEAKPKAQRASNPPPPPLPIEKLPEVPQKKTEDKPQEKLEWFNDPYLLSARVKELLKGDGNEEEAVKLVQRHSGAGNAQVYGALLTGLGRKGLYKMTLQVYREMKQRRISPTPQGYTALINSLAEATSKPFDAAARTNRLQEARDIWDTIESPSPSHANTMLKVCLGCISEGGWELGWDIYRQMVPEDGERGEDVPHPDIRTFTLILRMCAELGGQQGFEAAMEVWADVQRVAQKRTETNGKKAKFIKSFVEIDDQVMSALLMACIRAEDMQDAAKALPIIQQWLGLSTDPEDSSKSPSKSSVYLSTPLLNHLMHLTSRLREPELALRWFDIATRKRGVLADEGIYNIIIGLLISTGKMEEAWKLSQSADVGKEEIGLRICAAALRTDRDDRKVWAKRAEDLVADGNVESVLREERGKADLRSLVNLAEIYVATKRSDDAWRLLERERANIIDITRRKLEKSVLAVAPILLEDNGVDSAAFRTSHAKRITALLSRNPRQEADLAARIKALHLTREICSERLRQATTEVERMRLSLIQRQLTEVLGIWDMVQKRAKEKARQKAASSEKVEGEGYKLVERANMAEKPRLRPADSGMRRYEGRNFGNRDEGRKSGNRDEGRKSGNRDEGRKSGNRDKVRNYGNRDEVRTKQKGAKARHSAKPEAAGREKRHA